MTSDGGQGRGERAYRSAVAGFSLIFVVLGLLVLIVTLANGGGPASTGFILGIAFLLVGAGRLWINMRSGS